MNLELMDYFIERIYQMYGATHFLARFLYKRWNVESLSSKEKVESFLKSELVQKAIIPHEINLIKRYNSAELKALGINLSVVDTDKHELVDSRFGYRWKQVYHGMGEVWLDLYHVIEPPVDDSKIIESMGGESKVM